MHDPEKFQAETIKAINDLNVLLSQVLSRQLAQQALGNAMLGVVHPAALVRLREEFDEEVVHLSTLLPPKFQRPEFWEDVEAAIEARIKHAAQPPVAGWKPPGAT